MSTLTQSGMKSKKNIKPKRDVDYEKSKVFSKEEFAKYIKYKHFVFMFLPVIIYFIIFKYIPMGGISLAFKDFQFKEGIWGSPWAGFKHFKVLFNTPSFWQVFRNTITISSYKLVFGFTAPIIFALALNEITNVRFKKTVQTISYLPHFLSWVVLGGLFMQFLSPSTGPVNIILKTLGFNPIYFLGDPKWFRSVLVSTHVWQSVGWGSIIYIAALAGIDTELYEAAEVDGANRWHKLKYISLPSIAPVVTIMFILAVGKITADDFDQIFNLYNTAVYSVGDVMGTYMYRRGIIDMSYEASTAIGLFQNLISFLLVAITNQVSKKINDYGIW